MEEVVNVRSKVSPSLATVILNERTDSDVLIGATRQVTLGDGCAVFNSVPALLSIVIWEVDARPFRVAAPVATFSNIYPEPACNKLVLLKIFTCFNSKVSVTSAPFTIRKLTFAIACFMVSEIVLTL